MIPTKDEITIVMAGTLDDWARPTGTTEHIVKCRIDYISKLVKDAHGNEVISKAVILIKGAVLVTVKDTIRWVDVFGEHIEKPISVSPIKDLSGKVLFTKVVI